MNTSCPYCQTLVVHTPAFVNKRVLCPKCHKQFIIPDPQGIAKVPVAPAESPAVSNHNLLALSILGSILVLCVATCAVVGVLLLKEKESNDPQTAAVETQQPQAARSFQPFEQTRPPLQQTPQGRMELPPQSPPALQPPTQALRPSASKPNEGGNRLEDLKRQLEQGGRNPSTPRTKAKDFLVLDAEGYADGNVVLDFFHQERMAYAKAVEGSNATGRTRQSATQSAMNRTLSAFYGTPVKFQGTIRSLTSRRTGVIRGGRTYPAATWSMVVTIRQREDEPADEIHLNVLSEATFYRGDKVLLRGQLQSILGVQERAFHEKPLMVVLGEPKIEKTSEQTKVDPPPQPAKPSTPENQTVKSVPKNRLPEESEEDLRKQLFVGVPEVGLNQDMDIIMYGMIAPRRTTGSSPFSRARAGTAATPPTQLTPDFGPQFFTRLARSNNRNEFATLPWRSFPHCQLGKELAENLNDLSLGLRACLRAATPRGHVRPDAANLKRLLATPGSVGRIGSLVTNRPADWKTKAAIPALVQLLQVENAPVRVVLVEILSDIPGKEASEALAKRALFDLSAEVRHQAVQALSKRPPEQYQEQLVAGFRYPWPAAATHAANALVELNDKTVVSAVSKLKDEPNPHLPFSVEIQKKNGKESILAIREVVRINHMSNCLLCHAPSTAATDMVRGRVPIPKETPPQLYYAEQTGTVFARADTTFLIQDFSVMQPVTNAGTWPGEQRFDYLARVRPLTKKETLEFEKLSKDQSMSFVQRDALRFVLKELTAKVGGEDTKPLKEGVTVPKNPSGERP